MLNLKPGDKIKIKTGYACHNALRAVGCPRWVLGMTGEVQDSQVGGQIEVWFPELPLPKENQTWFVPMSEDCLEVVKEVEVN
jgi:hypothetical protein